jgi:hypothetical protein
MKLLSWTWNFVCKISKWNLFLLLLLLLLLGIGIGISCSYTYFNEVRAYSKIDTCQHRIRRLALAIHEYASFYGQLPPAIIFDDMGKPMHNWRALILPFLDEPIEYDYSVSWNHPKNIHLHNKMPDVFRCPCEVNKSTVKCESSYDMIFNPDEINISTSKLSSKNILLIEVFNTGVNWLEPVSLNVSVISEGIKSFKEPIQSLRPGSQHRLSNNLKDNFSCVNDFGESFLLPSNVPNRLIEILVKRNINE